MALTEKQRRFVEAYMGRAKGNAMEAAIAEPVPVVRAIDNSSWKAVG